MNKYTYVPPCAKEELMSDYQSGMTQCEIAAKYSTSQKRIWKAMKKFGVLARVAAKRDQWGGKNHQWKASDASYSACHFRVERAKGKPQECEYCGSTDPHRFYDWANMTGRYEDISDYKRLCRSCHWKLDRKILNISQMRKRGATNASK